ncbi:hypothetical protein P7K49_038005 [Saguinus oedipus]|uniref:Uncharacterized protein n=1 Tax=Saguinus oedipus TaxID=9490 RepID=A0ABQ9TDF1_SAGOE|nr:hypothetical protein P7K49_038005 [Saguinus oedipus]
MSHTHAIGEGKEKRQNKTDGILEKQHNAFLPETFPPSEEMRLSRAPSPPALLSVLGDPRKWRPTGSSSASSLLLGRLGGIKAQTLDEDERHDPPQNKGGPTKSEFCAQICKAPIRAVSLRPPLAFS